jgi:hypothetical protein
MTRIEKNVYFDPLFGDTFLYSGSCLWKNGSEGDNVTVGLYGVPTQLQTSVNLNLILDGTKVKYSPGGPGTGTHGFASSPVLILNKTGTGSWNYSPSTGLVPDLSENGKYDIFTEEKEVFRMVNSIELVGNSNGYVNINGFDSSQIKYPYFIKIIVTTNGNSNIYVSFYMSLYREYS